MARVWLAVAEGDTRRAAGLATEHGQSLAARGEWREAAVLLDEAVMFSDRTAAESLLGFVDALSSPVSRARAARAKALLSGSVEDLLAAAEAFAAVDFVHSAATLAARAAQALRADGDPRGAAAAEARARAWADASPGLRIDGLSSVAGAALLTPREKEIATLAARGRTSKEVAVDLVLSVRTVDNHLANVYAKLGIGGRAELAAALGVTEDAAVPAPRPGRTA
jgi:DNA-binding CsgD family transcriptional regulator